MKRLSQISLPDWTVPIALLAVCWFSFGLLAPQLGFYWDDWAKLLVGKVFGLQGYWAYYAEDRPLSGWTHILLTPLLGYKPLHWQLFVLGLRWLTSLGVWVLARALWRGRPRLAVGAALIFAVYPVFTQQPIAVTFHQQWLQYALFVLSLILTVEAERRPSRFWLLTLLALLTMAAQLSVTEYFAPNELLRPIILWFLLAGVAPLRVRLGRWALRCLPYFALLAVFVIWRLFFIRLSGEDPYRAETLYAFLHSPLATTLSLIKAMFVDSFYVMVTQWAGPLDIGIDLTIAPFNVTAWLLTTLLALTLVLYLLVLHNGDPVQHTVVKDAWLAQVLLLGALGVIAGCMPAWITGRRVIEDFHANRYALPAMLGASLLLAGFVKWAARPRLPKAIILAGLVALSSLFHLRTAEDYRQIWQNQRDFFWQLSWRAPLLQPGTAVLSEEELFPNQGGFSTAAALNLLYPQPEGWEHLAYWYYGMQPRFQAVTDPIGVPLRTQFRTLTFEGETPASMLVYFEPERANCLWLLDGSDIDEPLLPELTRRMLPASDLARVLPGPAPEGYPDPVMFGAEPPRDWCWFYQKAALAGQQGDWQAVTALGEGARKERGYHPADAAFKTPHEWRVFIEGYARMGEWETAADLLLAADGIDTNDYRASLCRLWARVLAETPANPAKDAAAERVSAGMTCTAGE